MYLFLVWPTGDFRAQAVILQVAIAILVEQYAAFTAAPFGHQDTAARQTGRVVLHEFHVTQRDAMADRPSAMPPHR